MHLDDRMFSQMDFGPLNQFLVDEDITDISYTNNGQVWLKTLSQGIFRIENNLINNAFMEKLAFQCANVMGKTFNMAHPFLDAESLELRMNFVHDSIARNGIACVIRKTPAKIRLIKEKILEEKYITEDILDFLEQAVIGHCNIIVCGETGSGKTEFVKYLASKTAENEKLITIEDTLELHLDRIFPHRDIVAMKTNNIASYSDVLVTCMRQNPKWILLSEVRSAEAVMAVRNSISSGHYILSTIHADKAASIPSRMYSLLETNQDIDQFLKSIYRYIQLGVHIRGYQDKNTKRFVREVAEVTEFYVSDDNDAVTNTIYMKTVEGRVVKRAPSSHLFEYLEGQGVILEPNIIVPTGATEISPFLDKKEGVDDVSLGEVVVNPVPEIIIAPVADMFDVTNFTLPPEPILDSASSSVKNTVIPDLNLGNLNMDIVGQVRPTNFQFSPKAESTFIQEPVASTIHFESGYVPRQESAVSNIVPNIEDLDSII